MGTVFLVPTSVDFILGVMMLWIVATLPSLRQQAAQFVRDPLLWCIVVLLLGLGFSIAWSSEPIQADAVKIWFRIILSISFIFLISVSLQRPAVFEIYLYRAIILGALLSSLVCIFLYFYSPPDDNRLQGLFRFNNAGQAGRIFAAALPFLMAGLLLHRGSWRLLASLAMLATVIAIFFTDTRAAWTGGLLGLAAYGVSARHPRPAYFLGIMAASGALFIALILLALQYPDSLAHKTLWPRGDSFRLGIWSTHLAEIFQIAPLLGQGILTPVWVELGEYSFRGAHSMYLSTALQIGLPGLLLFLVSMTWCGTRLLHFLHIRMARIGLSLLLIGAVLFVFGGDRLVDKFNYVWFVFWFPVAVALSVKALDEKFRSDANIGALP